MDIPKQLGLYSPKSVIKISLPFSTCNTKMSNGNFSPVFAPRNFFSMVAAAFASIKMSNLMAKLFPVSNSPDFWLILINSSHTRFVFSSLHLNLKCTGKWQLFATRSSREYSSLNRIKPKSMSVCSTNICGWLSFSYLSTVFNTSSWTFLNFWTSLVSTWNWKMKNIKIIFENQKWDIPLTILTIRT